MIECLQNSLSACNVINRILNFMPKHLKVQNIVLEYLKFDTVNSSLEGVRVLTLAYGSVLILNRSNFGGDRTKTPTHNSLCNANETSA